MPQWGATPPALSLEATEYTLFALDSADGTAHVWARNLTAAGTPHDVVEVDGSELPGWLDRCETVVGRLAATRWVGWRIAAAGDEAGVLAVAAAARAAGLNDAEVTTFAESRNRRVVYCAHCKTTLLAPTRPHMTVDCHGCGRALGVRPHVSRQTGAYLGVAAR